jgi:PAS domain S-box-containing protein
MTAVFASVFVLLSSIFVLVGWALNLSFLKTVFSGLVTMKANTAMGLLVGALALLLLATGRKTRTVRAGMGVLAVMVGLLGALSLAEYFFGRNFHIDEMLFLDADPSVGTSAPGRMSPSTAFSFMLMGAAFWVAARGTFLRSRVTILSALGATLVLMGSVAVLGQISNALLGFRLWNYFGMAIHTALGICLLGAGLLACVRTESRITWALNRKITVGFILSIAIMLTAAGISWNYTHRLQESAQQVSRTNEILKVIEEVRADKATLETAQRNYLILGDEQFLTSRQQLREEIHRDLAALRQLTAGDPRQQSWLNQLEPLMARRAIFTDQIIAARRSQGLPAVQQIMATEPGLKLSAQITAIHQAMYDEESAQLATRQEEADAASTVTFLVLPLAVFLSLTLISLALFFLNTGIDEQVRAEGKLKDSLKKITDLQTALDEHAIVAVTDAQGRITSVNDKFCAISGYARAELIGQDHRLINSGFHAKSFIRDLWTTISEGRVWQGEIRNKAKNGSFYWVDTTIVPFLNEDGEPRQFIAVRTDITERKRAEVALQESEWQFRTMVNAIPQLAWMAHPDGSIYWYNERWFDYTGTTLNQMQGWGWQRVHDPAALPQVLEKWKGAIEKGAPFEMEFPLRAADGHYGWFLTRIIPFKDESGRVVRWFGTNTDLSQKRSAEEEIRGLNTSLEKRVAERTAELESANKELEAFSYSVSHDLRAPLRAVDGFSQAVLEDFGPQLPPEGRNYLQTIRDGAQRMGMLIDDLLTFSRLSRAPLTKRTVETDRLVRGVLDELRPEMQGRHVDIQLGKLPPCEGDAALLKQVWHNLISNAVKYTRKRDAAVIEIGCEPGEKSAYFVRDNGAGFEMRYAGKLFGVFQRLHRADEFEGTGVGLAIVQRIIHRHEGRIWADAEPDRGATFHFVLQNGKENHHE